MKVAIITPYPPNDAKHIQTTGVASYSKNLVNCLKKRCKVVVISEKIEGVVLENTDDVQVIPTWKKGVFYPFAIRRSIKHSNPDVIHIQHETFIFGNMISALIFPLLLLSMKRFKKPIIVTMHGVLPLSKIDREFLIENKINGQPSVLKLGTRIITNMIVALSDEIIVHEDVLKESLIMEYKCRKNNISVVPHGVETQKEIMDPAKAKKDIGMGQKNVILFLGYITGYKNINLVINCMPYLRDKNTVLIIAGGEHPRMKEDPDYKEYISSLKEAAQKIAPDQIFFKGFIPEEKLPTFMAAADVLVFPYNICMSTSGPLAIAISYRKPFLVSRCFEKVVPIEEAKFNNDPINLAKKIDDLLAGDSGAKIAIQKYIDEAAKVRSWENVASTTYEIFENQIESKSRSKGVS